MVLGFKNFFVAKILAGTKIHTIREDKNQRWKKGRKIHFATGVRTKDYTQFKQGICTMTQKIILEPSKRTIYLERNGSMHLLAKQNHPAFIFNDGFDSEDEFWQWFNEEYHGFVIYWTDYSYI